MVGTDRSMKNILKLLDQTIEDNKNIMSDLLVKDGSIYEKALSVKYPGRGAGQNIAVSKETDQEIIS